MPVPVRLAATADAPLLGRMLDAFQREYDDITPGATALAARIAELIDGGDADAVLGGDGPDGFAILRFRPSLFADELECYLAELYVTPGMRGHGIGRSIMEFAIAHARARGAGYMDLGTSETDVAARTLYESLGFRNTENGPDGPVMYVYDREL